MPRHYGIYGGQYVAETLMPALNELDRTYQALKNDPGFRDELNGYLRDYIGRESPLFLAERLSEYAGGARIYLKREDLNHTGAHKVNNTSGRPDRQTHGKKCLIAKPEPVCTAWHAPWPRSSAWRRGCSWGEDVRARLRCSGWSAQLNHLGAQRQFPLKYAMNEALRQWIARVTIPLRHAPCRSPSLSRNGIRLQSVSVARPCQILKKPAIPISHRLRRGGSNAIGMFRYFIPDASVRLTASKPAFGLETASTRSICGGRTGVIHGCKSICCRRIRADHQTHSVSAGSITPGRAEHSHFTKQARQVFHING